jgi:hypothetical protein
LSLKCRLCDFSKRNSPGAAGGQPTSPRSSDLSKLILYRKSDAAKAVSQALAGYKKQVFLVHDSFLKGEGVSAEVARLGWTVRKPLEARANESEKTILVVDGLENWAAFTNYYYYECQGIEVESLMIDLSSKIFVERYLGRPGCITTFNIKTILLRAVSHITVLFECDNDNTNYNYNYKSDPIKSMIERMQGYCKIEDLPSQ